MSEYKHGAYGNQLAEASKVAARGGGAMVVVGTAPVHTVAGGAANVNKCVLVSSMGEARRLFGYSDNWADFTICEAMNAILEKAAVGPLVLVNVFDPAKHKSEETGTKSLTPEHGRITLTAAENVILDSVTVPGKTLGTDYSIAYNQAKKTIVISENRSGALGTAAIEITYESVDPAKVTEEDVIGTTDGLGLNTGLYTMKNVYQVTGVIPAYLLCPGFSAIPAVHEAMIENSRKINKHWDAWIFADIPLTDSDGAEVTLDTAHSWRKLNGYNAENETVSFPMVKDSDGQIYHLSVKRAANHLALLIANGGIPYYSASNTGLEGMENLWMGESNTARVYNDEIINEKLCKNGIASAAYIAGRWALWGAHAADYDQENADFTNVSETNRMMMYYITNDYQHRRGEQVDKPLTANDIQSIVAEEQARLDALVKMGALTYGKAYLDTQAISRSDMYNGDYLFSFEISATPLAKSLTAEVCLTTTGYEVFFAALA